MPQVGARPQTVDWYRRRRHPAGFSHPPAGEPGPPLATFPAGPRQVLVELFVAGGWVDITSYAYSRDPVVISRGLSAEANVTDPATLSLTVNNRSGRFSPRNPTGPYYGLIGRNTPIRVKVAGYHAAGWRGRFHGEVSSWPQRWDPSGADAWVPLEAAGVLRRLGQGAPLRSTLYRRITTYAAAPVAYWPCEDEERSTSVASGIGGKAMVVTGTPAWAADTSYACSAPVLTLGTAKLSGTVPGYASTAQVQLRFLLHVPAAGSVNGAVLLRLFCGGTLPRWDVVYTTGGGFLTLKAYDPDGILVLTSSGLGFVDGSSTRISVELSSDRDPAEVDYALRIYDPLGGGITSISGSVTGGRSVTRATAVTVNPAAADLTDVAVGHISVQAEDLPSVLGSAPSPLFGELPAFAGETAGARMLRLGAEEGVPVQVVGDATTTAAMGPQYPDTLLNLLREAAGTDGGLLYEPRDGPGLAYRTRASMYNRAARLTVAYTAHQLSALEPVDDDRHVRNDVTVTRRSGSSARQTLGSGALSTLPPPDGVGRYDETVTVNTETDAALGDHAGWRLHLGTVDEPRYPAVELNLASPALASDQALSEAALDLDVGDRLAVTGPPAWLPPDDISTGVQGLAETVNTFEHTISVSTVPESPYHVAVYDQDASRYASAGSTLVAAIGTGTTPFQVSTPAGPLWSHADGDFAILVGGERMRVAIISPVSATVQEFDVERSVNGVNKTHAAGEAVELFRPVFYSL